MLRLHFFDQRALKTAIACMALIAVVVVTVSLRDHQTNSAQAVLAQLGLSVDPLPAPPPGSVEYLKSTDELSPSGGGDVIEVWHEVGTDRTHQRMSIPRSGEVIGEISDGGRSAGYAIKNGQVFEGSVLGGASFAFPGGITGLAADSLRSGLLNSNWRSVGSDSVDGRLVKRIEKEMPIGIADPPGPPPGPLKSHPALFVLYVDSTNGLPVLQETYQSDVSPPVLWQRTRFEYQVIPPAEVPPDLFQVPGPQPRKEP